MKEKPEGSLEKEKTPLYERIRRILESARSNVGRTVNTTQVMANWLIGREIVEEEQGGEKRAAYGEQMIADLSKKLQKDFGIGYGTTNLKLFRKFFLAYPAFLKGRIGHTPCDQLWEPGLLHPNLSWSLYRHLLRVESSNARAFYEIEAIRSNWSARELERQINSLLYERLALSKDKRGLLRLAKRGQEIQTPVDIFKDPVVMEFLGLPEVPKLVESDLEQALINNLQAFLLEMGKGFAFLSRQERITLDGDHF